MSVRQRPVASSGIPLACVLLLCACAGPGRAASPSSTTRPAASASSAPSAVPSGVTVSTSVAQQTLTVVITVSGPATLEGGCFATAPLTLRNSAGTVVNPPLSSQLTCGAIELIKIPAGTTRSFTETMQLPSAAGTYSLTGTVGGHRFGPYTVDDAGS